MNVPKSRKEKGSLGNIAVNGWMNKTYEIVSPLSAQAALARIAALYSNEGVTYKVDSFGVHSTRTPIVVLSFQPRLYSHNNWVGLNPFVFVSGVDVRCEHCEGGLTKVIVRINRWRAFLFVAFWIWCSGLAAAAMPEPGGAILVIGVSCAAWFTHVSFLGGYLVKKEIADHLKVSKNAVGVTL